VWTNLRDDTPLPGSNAATAFGTTPSTPPKPATPNTDASSPAASLNGVPIELYNSTAVPHLALYAADNLKAMGLDAQVGPSKRYSGYNQTEILYPPGELAQAQALQSRIVGSVTLQQSRSAANLTLVIGQNRPAGLVAAPSGGTTGSDPDAPSTADPSASISAESRTGDENICSDLPDTVKFGGHP
jgi:hypothetical protein